MSKSRAKNAHTATNDANPAAALILFRDEMFDLVITDLAMPHITGLELARQMLQLRPGTKIMLMTGFSATMDASAARENGFREMLLKPYNIQELSSTVRRVLDEA